MTDLQKAGLGKRIMAAIFDGTLLATLAVGLAVLLSICFGYDAKVERYSSIMDGYEQQVGVDLQESTAEMSEAEQNAHQEKIDAVYDALIEDDEFMSLYEELSNLRMLMLSFGLLGAVLVIEFFVPLMFGNGQTLGKKIFGIGVMHIEGIRVTGKQMFIRSVLGKYTIELMLPIYIGIMTLTGGLGMIGLILLAVLLIAQVICLIITRTNAPFHDILASTVTVDFASQHIFEDMEDRNNYIKKVHAERVERSDY